MKLAWRNIWRNSRRSLLTIAAVCFATLLSVAMRGMQIGTYESLIRNIVRSFIGYVQVQRTGYLKIPSLQLAFPFDDSLRNRLSRQQGVVGMTPRVHADGLISLGDQSQGAMIIGIVPETERSVSNLHTKVKDGQFLISDSSRQIVLGYKLMKNLAAKVGDKVVILAQGFDGSLGNMKYTIAGTLKTGSPDVDGTTLFMGMSDARELLGMSNQVHVVVLSLSELQRIEPVKRVLSSELQGSKLDVLSWDEVSPEMMNHMELDNVSGMLLLGILIVIVAFGILNTVLMSVTERFREFGIVLSMGMNNNRLMVLVAMETMLITLSGVIVGDLLAWCVNYWIVLHPIAIGGLESIEEQLGIDYKLLSTVRPSVFINSSLAVFGISMLVCLYPIHRVLKLEPLKGIRFT